MNNKGKDRNTDFTLPVTWEVCGFVKISAKNLEEAIEKFNETTDDIALPENGEYVDGSFQLTSQDYDFIALYNKDKSLASSAEEQAAETECSEFCPFCEEEVTVLCNCEKEFYETICPNCKKKIMLCSECLCDDSSSNCDWNENTDCYRNNYGISSLARDYSADLSTTAYGEPQAFIPLANGRTIEVCCEQNMLSKSEWFYSVRLLCSEAEEGRYEDTLDIISTQVAKTVSEMNKLIKRFVKQNSGLPAKTE